MSSPQHSPTVPNKPRICASVCVALLLLLPGSLIRGQQIDRSSSVEHQITGADSLFVPLFSYVEDDDDISLGHAALNVAGGTQVDSLVHQGSLGLNYCNNLTVHSGALRISLDLGEDYIYDTLTFSVNLSLKIEGYDNAGGGSVLITHNPVVLAINQNAPEQTFYVEYSGGDLTNHDQVDVYRVIVNSYLVSGAVTGGVRLTVSYEDEYAVDAVRPSPDEADPIVVPFPVGGSVTGVHTANPLQLQWGVDVGCADRFPGYQVQVLRLYNTDSQYDTDPVGVKGRVNWDEALTIDVAGTDASTQSVDLTLPQGTGWYLWRVRPIGSLHEGGGADGRNWGVWSEAPINGDVIEADNHAGTGGAYSDTCFFFYKSFEDTLLWTYSRGFTEGENGGTRVGEGMTFLSPMGRPVQSQVRSAEDGVYLTGNSVVDFQGRATLSVMGAPVGNSSEGFEFRPDLLNITASDPYTAEAFDHDTNLTNPLPPHKTSGSASEYYDGTTVESGSRVPDAEDYPFSRVLLSRDGSSRPKELSGVGEPIV